MQALSVERCCAIYDHPLAAWLPGDSLHPGGLELTTRLAGLLAIGPDSSVLDAGSGRGASAVHLARHLGCSVVGITLEPAGVAAGRELAERHGVTDRVEFIQGELREVDLGDRRFDFVLMECVLSILDRKGAALRRLLGLLKPGGRLGLTDVTASCPLPPEMQAVLATAGCVGGALSLVEYGVALKATGFAVEHSEDCPGVATSFLHGVGGMLVGAEVAGKLGKLRIDDSVVSEGRRLLAVAAELVHRGVLGYGLLVARRPR